MHIQNIPDRKATPGSKSVALTFGALCPSIRQQLEGFDVGNLSFVDAQADADAITRLYVRGFISNEKKDALYKSLIKRIAQEIAN